MENCDEDEQEEEDENVLDRADQRERILAMKQDVEKSRQRRTEQRYVMEDVPANRLSKTLEKKKERLKQLHLEEEAVSEAEKRLIQEAKKRQVRFNCFDSSN